MPAMTADTAAEIVDTDTVDTAANTADTGAAKETLIIRRLRAAWLRPTLARVKALEMLSENPGFQDVNSVFRWLIGKEIPVTLGTIYHALQSLHKAGFVLCAWGMDHVVRYSLKTAAATPRLRLVCGESGESAVFSDPELYARLVSAAVREGLNLAGRPFELRVDSGRQAAEDFAAAPAPLAIAENFEESLAFGRRQSFAKAPPRRPWQVIERISR
jgi:Fe2+ or Zn2+ uptake regulation protein